MKKQTAVEWVLEQFNEIHTQRKWKEVIEQALEMEKQQIEDAWDDGFDRGYGYSESKYDSSQQYYNKTYKK